MSRINVLFIIDSIRLLRGGTERHLYHLVKNLDPRRFNCSILSFDLEESCRKRLADEGIDIHEIRVGRYWGPDGLRKAFQLRDLIRRKHIDVVQTYHFKSDTYGALVARWAGVHGIISSRRDTGDTKKAVHLLVNRIANTQIDRFITVCDRVGERIEEDEGVPASRRLTIYNGIDLRRFRTPSSERLAALRQELGIPADAFVVGKTGYFRPEKGFRNFFRGIAKARASIPTLRALALGHGTEFEACRAWCRKAGIDDCVIFAGKVAEVVDYLALMDVACLVPGSNEGLSNAVLEKMAMGKPLVVTDVGGNAELVHDGGNGFVIPPDDPGRLAEALVRLYRDPDLARRMGQESRRRVAEDFPFEAVIRNHEELIASVAGKPGCDGDEDGPDADAERETGSAVAAR